MPTTIVSPLITLTNGKGYSTSFSFDYSTHLPEIIPYLTPLATKGYDCSLNIRSIQGVTDLPEFKTLIIDVYFGTLVPPLSTHYDGPLAILVSSNNQLTLLSNTFQSDITTGKGYTLSACIPLLSSYNNTIHFIKGEYFDVISGAGKMQGSIYVTLTTEEKNPYIIQGFSKTGF